MKISFEGKMYASRRIGSAMNGDDIIKLEEVESLDVRTLRDFLETPEVDYAKLNGWKDSKGVALGDNDWCLFFDDHALGDNRAGRVSEFFDDAHDKYMDDAGIVWRYCLKFNQASEIIEEIKRITMLKYE